MIRLATLFSGIGAIEHAFDRLNIEHEIVFACDNGDIPINIDYEKEMQIIKSMHSIEEKKNYANGLYHSNSRKHNFVEQSYLSNYTVKNNNFFYDIKLLDGSDFKNKVDLLVGGSPCQSFSIAGQRGGFEDTRGTLFYEYVRLVKEVQPKVFIYENVYGVLTHDKGRTWDTMQNVFNELGYSFKYKIMDAKNYGIPQSRRRIFVIGFKDKKQCDNFQFPTEIPLQYKMQDFLLDNCAEGNFKSINGSIQITKGEGQIPNNLFLSTKLIKYVMSPGTKGFMHPEDTKIDLPIARAILSTQGNTHRASVNNYVTTNGKIRALAPRESLRLMGFDDSFKIVVSKAQSYKQSGNSIVVDILISIIKSLLKTIDFKPHFDRVVSPLCKYPTVSLFSGIGGFDLGFSYAGFNIIWANDFDKYAVQTYKKNVGNQIVLGDIRTEKYNIPKHDVLIAGFPCQPFSTLGKQQGFNDEEGRGTLFFEIKDILKRNKTKVVVLENVKNILHHDNGNTFNRIIHELNQLGYSCYYSVLNSADYGVPQRRNRLYIVAFLSEFFNNKEFIFPEKTELLFNTQDILDKSVDKKYFLSKNIINTILGKGTKNFIVNPTIDQPISKTLTATMNKMHRASQDNYITDDVNYNKFHDETKTNIRKLTPNECRKLQGFPDDWQQVVSDCQAYKQFGNAVTVNVTYTLAQSLMSYIDNNKKNNW